MTHTHPQITHPALRRRIAVALNQLRYVAAPSFNDEWYKFNEDIAYRQGLRAGCHQMALEEQKLDEAQFVRVAGRLWQVE